jgi:hypothetical protein
MNDLTDRLASLSGPRTGPPADDTVAADLSRGQAALRRRRNRMRAGGALSVAALAIVGAAGYFVASGIASPHRQHLAAAPPHQHVTATQHRHVATATHQHGNAAPKNAKIKLVDYTGQNPPGFTIASVPQGFGLQTQASTGFAFILAPPSADKNPGSFEGKLVVTAEAGSELGNWHSFGHAVTVNGSQARLSDGGTATSLWFSAGNGVVVNVQAWANIGLTDQQLISFADGVATTSALQLSHG